MSNTLQSLLCISILCFSPLLTKAQTGAKTTGARHKIVAITNCTSDGYSYIPTDSFTYTYSGNRDGFAYPSNYSWTYSGNFDTTMHYVYSGIAGGYQIADRSIQTYDASSNVLSYISQRYDSTKSSWTNYQMATYTYDAHNNMQTMTNALWGMPMGGGPAGWQNSYMYRYVYDTANNLVSDSMLSADTTVWLSYSADMFLYDTHHNLTEQFYFTDYTGSWDTSMITHHWLNAGFKPDSITAMAKYPGGTLGGISIEKFTYDVSYNMLTDTLFYVSSTMLIPRSIDIYTYSGSSVTSHETRNNKTYTSSPTWVNISYKVMAYDASNNPISIINRNWNTSFSMYVNANNDTNTFSTFNKITSYTTTSWNDTKKIWVQQNGSDAQSRYYYDTLPGLNTKAVAEITPQINLYPSPAVSTLNIEIQQPKAQSMTLAIYDVSGRLYRQWTANATSDYRFPVSVAGLHAGNYLLSVRSGDGRYVQQFSVVH